MNTTLLGALGAISLVTTAWAQGAANAPCLATPLGTNLGLTDDSVSQNNALGFAFPVPGGGTVTSIDISSNGFVWLGSNTNNGCCTGYLPDFLTNTPRIAPYWADLNPSFMGAVWFNTFPAVGSQPASAVVTWDGVPEYGNNVPMTIQLQMFADGSFVFAYDATTYNSYHDVLVGVTQGINAVANPVDFSTITTANPYLSAANPTIHENLVATWDLAGKSYSFTPIGTTGYLVLDRPQCTFGSVNSYGVGCPDRRAAGYEFFQNPALIDLSNTAVEFVPNGSGYVGVATTGFFGGYTNAYSFGDDDSHGPFNLPFTFPYPSGSTNAIDIASNGFIWLQTGNFNSRCCNGDPTSFLSDPASIAALWMDLYPPGGGNIYFDTVGTTEAHITWVSVPEFYTGPPQTAQITLRSNGTFRLSWGTVSNSSHNVLVGFTQGDGVVDPGPSDFSVGPVIVPNGGIPLLLSPQSGSRPVINTTFTMQLDQITPPSVLGIMILGLTSFVPPIDLTGIGMPGCSLHVSLDTLLTFALSGPPAPFALPIPNNASLVSAVVFAQGATLTPGSNAFGFLSSNGLQLTIGN